MEPNTETHPTAAAHGGFYDVILLLSVTKWVHLHHGDDGITALFEKCHRLLRPGGVLVVEPQKWKCYGSAWGLMTTRMRDCYRSIRLKPKDFVKHLTNERKFRLMHTIETSKTREVAKVPKDFRRQIHVLRGGERQAGWDQIPPSTVFVSQTATVLTWGSAF
uniref:RNA methyltransferase n=1 Tax=Chromera velia CCMP2878 TaxID=1169474 RepID=A0A0G4HQ79_9ALVE|eukprot:Cvel_30114.t1-p1 / transcript=Cvel_30114.t1 / gene=Cvel_30114 / organism=Chromera_velia_CCMP2878 / gene_product=Probable RNA methyltransferase At5g51130, putative / transcript_product=Probable RNA methyltransferase At5g51130, putative / location=Cvel_scaffold4248:6476-6958(+) / protein_length=161 / sequence_SO=supercontig / SO=protein_coding / is_pseudo=false